MFGVKNYGEHPYKRIDFLKVKEDGFQNKISQDNF